MADDKKISEMLEVTAGNLLDNMQLEVFDPNEALVEDQNKRIRFDTLEGIFGAEDKIFEGDSSVEVVDAGTGVINFTVDGGLVGDWNASGLILASGSRVNEIEATLTDDDTHLPTSGAVVDAISAFNADKILEGDSSVEVIDAGTGQVLITVDGNPIFDVTAAGLKFGFGSATVNLIETVITDDDTRFPTSGAVVDALAADVKDIISEGDTSVEVIDIAGGQVVVTVDGSPIYDVTAAGLAFATGARVDTIETTLTDDDTHLPTSGAVFDAIAALSGFSPDISVGVADTTRGTVYIYGDNASAGGRARWYVGDTQDGNGTDYFEMRILNDDLIIGPNNDPTIFKIVGGGTPRIETEVVLDANSLQLSGSGATQVDTIETTLTDDDTHLPTSGAVVDAIAAISIPDADKIIEGNSSVEVIDAGTGQVDTTIDGALKSTMNADGLQLKGDQTGAEAIGNAATTVAVTFGTAHADANYQVLATVENLTDVTVLSAMITAKATTGFTATLSAATGTANYVLNWMVVRS